MTNRVGSLTNDPGRFASTSILGRTTSILGHYRSRLPHEGLAVFAVVSGSPIDSVFRPGSGGAASGPDLEILGSTPLSEWWKSTAAEILQADAGGARRSSSSCE